MKKKAAKVRTYSPLEEKLNIYSHGLGFLLAIPATVMLILKASMHGNAWQIVSVSIYGLSMMTLYLASTLYHSATEPKRRHRLNVFDQETARSARSLPRDRAW